MVPGSPNPDLIADIADKKCHFPHPFSDQITKIHTHSRTWPNLACSRLSDSWGDSPNFSRFIFVFALFQFREPNYLGTWNRLGLIRQKLRHHYQVRAETKNSPNAFRFGTFLVRSYSFGIDSISTSIHIRSRSSLENHTRFQTKMGKVFSDQKGPKSLPFPYIREYPLILTPFMMLEPRQGLKMGEENSILTGS